MSSQSSQSQDENISQFFPNGQRTQLSLGDRLSVEQEKFNCKLITQNNNEAEDKGVHDVLLALNNKDNKLKALDKSKVLKPQLLAGLGFLHNIDYQQAGDRFKGVTVDRLKNMIVER